MNVEQVVAADGTVLALERAGAGTPLLLVHGSATDRRSWDPLVEELASDFECLLFDRRGHGDSGPAGSDYTIATEAADLACVISHLGVRPLVVAHSWGACCALEALLGGAVVAGALLYEPSDPAFRPYDDATLQRFVELEAAAPAETVLRFYFGTIAQVPDAALDRMVGSPDWEAAAAAIGTLSPESLAFVRWAVTPGALAGLTTPVRLLTGLRSPPSYGRSVERIAGRLPQATVRGIDGQGHVAHVRDPAGFASLVRDFATDVDVAG